MLSSRMYRCRRCIPSCPTLHSPTPYHQVTRQERERESTGKQWSSRTTFPSVYYPVHPNTTVGLPSPEPGRPPLRNSWVSLIWSMNIPTLRVCPCLIRRCSDTSFHPFKKRPSRDDLLLHRYEKVLKLSSCLWRVVSDTTFVCLAYSWHSLTSAGEIAARQSEKCSAGIHISLPRV